MYGEMYGRKWNRGKNRRGKKPPPPPPPNSKPIDGGIARPGITQKRNQSAPFLPRS